MDYLLNSAVLTAFGTWDYTPMSHSDAIRWLHACAHPACQATQQWHREPGCVCLHSSGQGDDGQVCADCRGTGQRHAWTPRWQSTIGYAETATALEVLAGLDAGSIPVERRTIAMRPGDEALVFRLVLPPGAPRIAPGDKGQIAGHVDAGHWELGRLARLS